MGAVPTRAAIGIRLPWVLGHDADRQAEWIELLFGPAVDQAGRDACWQAYLLYSRLFRDTVGLLAPAYTHAVDRFDAARQLGLRHATLDCRGAICLVLERDRG
jgi:hypothetical protein